MSFLRNTIRISQAGEQTRVWRVSFVPRVGVSVSLLDKEGVEEVEAGEDRVGFLPRWYWDVLRKENTDPPLSIPAV
jgi:RAT1-interacting protein